MEFNTQEWLQLLAPVVVAGAAAWGGVKTALNGLRARMQGVAEKLDEHIKDDHEIQTKVLEGLARVDQKLEDFIKHKG